MNTIQKIIRLFAILLAVAIIAGICNLAYQLIIITIPINTKIVVEEYKKEFKGIDSLDIDVGAANIVIKEGEKTYIEAYNLPSKLTVKKNGNTLKVRQHTSYMVLNSGDIIITVPKEMQEIELDGGSGTITISNLIMDKLDLNIGAGKTTISNIEAKNVDIDGGAGTLNIESSKLNNLDLDSGAGSVTISSYLTGKSKIDCGVGRTNITLLGEEDDYEINAEKGLGNLSIAGKEYGNKINYGKGKNKIKVSGGVGEIIIRFKK